MLGTVLSQITQSSLLAFRVGKLFPFYISENQDHILGSGGAIIFAVLCLTSEVCFLPLLLKEPRGII